MRWSFQVIPRQSPASPLLTSLATVSLLLVSVIITQETCNSCRRLLEIIPSQRFLSFFTISSSFPLKEAHTALTACIRVSHLHPHLISLRAFISSFITLPKTLYRVVTAPSRPRPARLNDSQDAIFRKEYQDLPFYRKASHPEMKSEVPLWRRCGQRAR